MSVCAGGVRIARRAGRHVGLPVSDLPLFLCPSFIGISRARCQHRQPCTTTTQKFLPISSSASLTGTADLSRPADLITKLPLQCSGCGALSQVVDKDEAGYYNVKRKSVEQYLRRGASTEELEEDSIVEKSLQAAADLDPGVLAELGFPGKEAKPAAPKAIDQPLCDRCHNIKHHDTGVSIHHPSIHSIEDTIFESPHKINHVYHVIDAADFPMSLIPGIHKTLNITPQRSLNRRSKTGKFFHGQKTDVSFVITRSDLLAPKKEQVDSMMPYLRDVLRDALGRAGKDVRLGNVRCVSAKQSWWIKDLKEAIWKRGGGGWMVGKVNVGKSQLFGEIFPKGRLGATQKERLWPPIKTSVSPEGTENSGSVVEAPRGGPGSHEASDTVQSGSDNMITFSPIAEAEAPETATALEQKQLETMPEDYLDSNSLLPPPQEETNYPEMPLVSSLPGTTASPIRVPFGNGKGELIDLPGLARGDLELHVQPEHRSSLIMRSRIRPEQQVIKHGQSLLLGGFIRITPKTPDIIFLAYNFNPLKPHLTSTERAIGTQTQTREANVENISLPGTGEKIASAGTFYLKWDVTKQRTGPVTSRQAAKVNVDRLPYRVMAADILIESVGWVEITAQIRKPRGDMFQSEQKEEEQLLSEEIDPAWPKVEVFSPEGRFVGIRRPMNAWLNFAQKPSEKNRTARPRKSMKGAKKNAKSAKRAMASV